MLKRLIDEFLQHDEINTLLVTSAGKAYCILHGCRVSLDIGTVPQTDLQEFVSQNALKRNSLDNLDSDDFPLVFRLTELPLLCITTGNARTFDLMLQRTIVEGD
ncbi:hypothetical protein GC176_03250 [bacterium]|nr:hypothetical protein [bacterium]